MKSNIELTESAAEPGIPKRFRRLKWHELVSAGDFVADDREGFQLWDGPSGFRADAFVRPIFRAMKSGRVPSKI
jgi:hypothetical protein